ncbi:MAG: recombinase family protein [Novosphingobium sp.]|nr:recombinase family protein [Novosphingobium sp.]MCP5403798.1 recombinase family protein [Novosphingobium sp.]
MTKVRCAIYTRKSSEEGLEQDFNSLDAQREACAAYILSQASEGWSLLPEHYDDGGLSGGTLERPALKRLLADIEAGKIDIVVVYKVDRLTRSLLDFAKLVETFDAAGTSFVSVTQSFNTTNSMGRLTLNMLLSFAQFEREVTAERIRDKIAASKARGMWMGGNPPLGYRPEGRSLEIVPEHAELIRQLFHRYLAVGNVRLLAEQLEAEGTRIPQRTALTGRQMGGGTFSRGQIYKILSNPIYLGEIHHRGKVYEGKHEAIIDRDLWDQVQSRLADNTQGTQRTATTKVASLLAGLVNDENGEPLVAAHACKGKQRYRYYVSRALQHDANSAAANGIRIPAREIEAAVANRIADALSDPFDIMTRAGIVPESHRIESTLQRIEKLAVRVRKKDRTLLRSLVSRVTVLPLGISIDLSAEELRDRLEIETSGEGPATINLRSDVRLTRSGRAVRLVYDNGRAATCGEPDQGLIQLLMHARHWWEQLATGEIDIAAIARNENINDSWVSRVVRLNFLAPQLVEAILSGTQPASINAASLRSADLPIDWNEQIAMFGL